MATKEVDTDQQNPMTQKINLALIDLSYQSFRLVQQLQRRSTLPTLLLTSPRARRTNFKLGDSEEESGQPKCPLNKLETRYHFTLCDNRSRGVRRYPWAARCDASMHSVEPYGVTAHLQARAGPVCERGSCVAMR